MLYIVRTNLFLARGGATQQVTFCGMLDLDRVEMILPQVHLRNGEESAEIIHLNNPSAYYASALPCGSPGRDFPLPFLSHSSAFAGDGLNIRRCAIHRTPPQPLQSLNVHLGMFPRRFAADCPLLHPRRCYHPRGRYPPCCTRSHKRAAVVVGFRASPTNLSQLRLRVGDAAWISAYSYLYKSRQEHP